MPSEKLVGTQLEEAGWRQGSIVKPQDAGRLLAAAGVSRSDSIFLVVGSQSCDIAHNKIEADPFVELSIAYRIEAIRGDLTHNKNPRALHTQITCSTGQLDVFKEENVELRAYEKLTISKEQLLGLTPDTDRQLDASRLQSYVAWLAARYSRPALPTAFNDRISDADPKGKFRDKAKKGNHQLSGIYVSIFPDRELSDDEAYSVNLLGLLPAGFTGDKAPAEKAVNAYAEVLRKAGMDIKSALKGEDEVSVAQIKRFKRLYFDDLSFRNDAPLPPETTIVL